MGKEVWTQFLKVDVQLSVVRCDTFKRGLPLRQLIAEPRCVCLLCGRNCDKTVWTSSVKPSESDIADIHRNGEEKSSTRKQLADLESFGVERLRIRRDSPAGVRHVAGLNERNVATIILRVIARPGCELTAFNMSQLRERLHLPVLRYDAHLGKLISRLHLHAHTSSSVPTPCGSRRTGAAVRICI